MASGEFSINFWIRSDANPAWRLRESNIRFAPLKVGAGQIVFEKEGGQLIAYIISDDDKRALVQTAIEDQLGKDTMVTLTAKANTYTLYLNGQKVKIS